MAKDASAEEKTGPNHKSKVVPCSVVVNLIKVHLIREYGNDECDGRNQAVPQAFPESCNLAFIVRGSLHVIGTWSTAGEKYNKEKNNS